MVAIFAFLVSAFVMLTVLALWLRLAITAGNEIMALILFVPIWGILWALWKHILAPFLKTKRRK